eukprot:m.15007 g.15007  ORF g.15007 m.15007 type:complete len:98 (-) comp10398_c0_seq1:802-1095(-)
MDISSLSPQEQMQFEAAMQRKQVQDFIGLYNRLSQYCFTACCNDFTQRKLSSKQKGCVDNCVTKFFQASHRIGTRFAEAQQLAMEGQQGGGIPGMGQ